MNVVGWTLLITYVVGLYPAGSLFWKWVNPDHFDIEELIVEGIIVLWFTLCWPVAIPIVALLDWESFKKVHWSLRRRPKEFDFDELGTNTNWRDYAAGGETEG